MTIMKQQISDFLQKANEVKKDCLVGVYNSKEKKVFNMKIPFHKLKDFIISFDAIYDENLVNKAFNEFKIFAIKIFDGKEYSLEDYIVKPKKEEKEKVVKQENVQENKNDDKEI